MGAALPLAGLGWMEYRGLVDEREAHRATEHEAAALGAALRADASPEDALMAAARGAPEGAEVLVVARDGSYQGAQRSGSWPALLTVAGDSVSGTSRLSHPASREEVDVAWARAPAADALVVLARPPVSVGAPLAAPFLLLAAFVSGGVAILLWFVARGVVEPVRRLERASRRWASGEWRERVSERGPEEVRSLARAFNAMADALERQRAELASLLDERTRDLIDREGDLEALRFTLAHEFREPLRSLQWMTRDLLDRPLTAEAREGVLVLRRRIDDLDAVFRDLLRYEDVSRRPFAPEPIALAAVLRAAEAEATKEDGLRVERVGDETVEVRGDRDLLVLGLSEILRNVAQHARPRRGDAVARVSVETRGDEVLVHVDDEGKGIPAARREDALHLFQRLRRDVPGTGAGLAIARRAVERHDGELFLGDAPSGGARVTLRLPLGGPAERTPLPQEPRRRRF